MIPQEEYDSPRGTAQQLQTGSSLLRSRHKNVHEIYKQLMNADLSDDVKRKMTVALYQGSDLFYKECDSEQ